MGKQFNQMTHDELAEAGRIGGIKSGQAKRAKKAMKETMLVLLGMPLKKGKCYDIEDIKDFASINGKNIDVSTAIAVKQVMMALKGNILSAEFVRDTSGQKPQENVNVDGVMDTEIRIVRDYGDEDSISE